MPCLTLQGGHDVGCTPFMVFSVMCIIVSFTLIWGVWYVTLMINNSAISVTPWHLVFMCTYWYLDTSMFNSVMWCMPKLHNGLQGDYSTQMALVNNVFKIIFLILEKSILTILCISLLCLGIHNSWLCQFVHLDIGWGHVSTSLRGQRVQYMFCVGTWP